MRVGNCLLACSREYYAIDWLSILICGFLAPQAPGQSYWAKAVAPDNVADLMDALKKHLSET
jgi:hypothetical protein